MNRLVCIGLGVSLGCAGGTPAPEEAPKPTVGFVTIEGHTCYAPPDFEGLTRSESQRLAQESLEDAKRHWRGEVDPTFKLSAAEVEELENRLLSYPNDTGRLLAEDLRLCRGWATGASDAEGYRSALMAFARGLDRGRCEPEGFTYLSQGLVLNAEWQMDLVLCAGQRVEIRVSNGRYCVDYPAKGEAREPKWIDAAGDPEGDVAGLPCTSEGCRPGMVIGQYSPWEGAPIIFPIGAEAPFTAPAHGNLRVRINDDTANNNRFYEKDQIPDFLVVEVTPGAG